MIQQIILSSIQPSFPLIKICMYITTVPEESQRLQVVADMRWREVFLLLWMIYVFLLLWYCVLRVCRGRQELWRISFFFCLIELLLDRSPNKWYTFYQWSAATLAREVFGSQFIVQGWRMKKLRLRRRASSTTDRFTWQILTCRELSLLSNSSRSSSQKGWILLWGSITVGGWGPSLQS